MIKGNFFPHCIPPVVTVLTEDAEIQQFIKMLQ